MPSAFNASKPTVDRHAEETAPNWDVVPFEVGCARCGHDLRGLTDPKCPACGLEFEWSKAVPIEQLTCRKCAYHLYGLRDTRCPECGEAFTWKQALDDYHRRQKPLFEYRWREQPIRSLVRTWWLTLQPRKLWRVIDIHDRPRVGPLIVTFIFAILALMVVGMVTNLIEQAIDRWSFARLMAARGRPLQMGWPPPMNWVWLAWNNRVLFEFARIMGVWFVLTLASLLVFQQSLRRCKVRTEHVFRACVYAVVGIAPLAVAATSLLHAVLQGFGIYWLEVQTATAALALVVVFGAWSVAVAYRRYLRMPHSVGVVIAAQVMAILASIIANMWLFLTPRGLLETALGWLD